MERPSKTDCDRILPVLRARLAGLGTTLAPALPVPVPAIAQTKVEEDEKDEGEDALSLPDHCYEYNRFSPVDPGYAALFHPDGSRKFDEPHDDLDRIEIPYVEVGDQDTPKGPKMMGDITETKEKRKRGISETLSEIFSWKESEDNNVEIIDDSTTYNPPARPAKAPRNQDPWEGVRQTPRHANTKEKWRRDLEEEVTGTHTKPAPIVVDISDDEEEKLTSEDAKTNPDQQGRELKPTGEDREEEQQSGASGGNEAGPDQQGGANNNQQPGPGNQPDNPHQEQGEEGENPEQEGEPVKHSISLLQENGHDPDDFSLRHSVNSLSARVRDINGGLSTEYAGPNSNRWIGYVAFNPNWDPETDLASYDIPGCPKFTDFSVSGSREPRVASRLQREVDRRRTFGRRSNTGTHSPEGTEFCHNASLPEDFYATYLMWDRTANHFGPDEYITFLQGNSSFLAGITDKLCPWPSTLMPTNIFWANRLSLVMGDVELVCRTRASRHNLQFDGDEGTFIYFCEYCGNCITPDATVFVYCYRYTDGAPAEIRRSWAQSFIRVCFMHFANLGVNKGRDLRQQEGGNSFSRRGRVRQGLFGGPN